MIVRNQCSTYLTHSCHPMEPVSQFKISRESQTHALPFHDACLRSQHFTHFRRCGLLCLIRSTAAPYCSTYSCYSIESTHRPYSQRSKEPVRFKHRLCEEPDLAAKVACVAYNAACKERCFSSRQKKCSQDA